MHWPQTPLKWFGLILVLAGVSLIPLTLLVLETLQVAFNHHQFRITLTVLLALGDGFLIAGVLIMMPRFSLFRRRVNSSPQPEPQPEH
jgi:hypothetical protein